MLQLKHRYFRYHRSTNKKVVMQLHVFWIAESKFAITYGLRHNLNILITF